MSDLLNLKNQSKDAKVVIIDEKEFLTNGIWQYDKPSRDGARPARSLCVGRIGWSVDVGNMPVWNRAALEGGEKEILRDIPRIVGGGKLINLGDLKGGSAILLAQGLKHNNLEGHVYTVDKRGSDEGEEYPNKYRGAIQDAESEKNRIESDTVDYITMIQRSTYGALPLFKDRYSFLFIDADHSYEGIRDDWWNYSPLIDGMIAFHDTNQDMADKVINEFVIKDWKLEYWINRIKIFSRR